jgi:hypothetical protein
MRITLTYRDIWDKTSGMKPVLRSRIIFMQLWLRLRVKILMRFRLRRLRLRLWLLPYCIAWQNFFNELNFKHMLKLSCSRDCVQFVLVKIWTEWVIKCYILCHSPIHNHVSYHCRSKDAAPCGSGSATLDETSNVVKCLGCNLIGWSGRSLLL